jgi:hypothetical protein
MAMVAGEELELIASLAQSSGTLALEAVTPAVDGQKRSGRTRSRWRRAVLGYHMGYSIVHDRGTHGSWVDGQE